MASYDKMFERLFMKAIKTDGGVSVIKTSKSGFSVGSYNTTYERFFTRRIDDDSVNTIDTSLYALWFMSVLIQDTMMYHPTIYSVFRETVTQFVNSFSNDEKSEMLRNLIAANAFVVRHLDDGTEFDEEELGVPLSMVNTILFLKSNHKWFQLIETNQLFVYILMIYFSSQETFFKLFKFGMVLLPHILNELYDWYTSPEIKISCYRGNGKRLSNSLGYCVAQVIKLYVELSELVCKNKAKVNESVEKMSYLGNDKFSESIGDLYEDIDDWSFLTNERMKALADSMESASLGDDHFSAFVKTGDFEELIKRFDTFVIDFKDEDSFEVSESGYELLCRLSKLYNKRLTMETCMLLYQSSSSYILVNNDILLQSAGQLFISSGYVNDLLRQIDSDKEQIDSLTEKYKAVKGSSKQNKKSAEDAKQARYKLESKIKKLEGELSQIKKDSISRSDFEELEESYNALLGKIRTSENSLKSVSDKLDEKTAECSKLLKENKQYKSQILEIKGIMSDLNLLKKTEEVSAKEEVSVGEKLDLINQFDVLVVGGVDSLHKALQQMGYSKYAKCCEFGDLAKGGQYDVVVICTNFCSHALVNMAKANFKNAEFIYFNNNNAPMFVDAIYTYFNDVMTN